MSSSIGQTHNSQQFRVFYLRTTIVCNTPLVAQQGRGRQGCNFVVEDCWIPSPSADSSQTHMKHAILAAESENARNPLPAGVEQRFTPQRRRPTCVWRLLHRMYYCQQLVNEAGQRFSFCSCPPQEGHSGYSVCDRAQSFLTRIYRIPFVRHPSLSKQTLRTNNSSKTRIRDEEGGHLRRRRPGSRAWTARDISRGRSRSEGCHRCRSWRRTNLTTSRRLPPRTKRSERREGEREAEKERGWGGRERARAREGEKDRETKDPPGRKGRNGGRTGERERQRQRQRARGRETKTEAERQRDRERMEPGAPRDKLR